MGIWQRSGSICMVSGNGRIQIPSPACARIEAVPGDSQKYTSAGDRPSISRTCIWIKGSGERRGSTRISFSPARSEIDRLSFPASGLPEEQSFPGRHGSAGMRPVFHYVPDDEGFPGSIPQI